MSDKLAKTKMMKLISFLLSIVWIFALLWSVSLVENVCKKADIDLQKQIVVNSYSRPTTNSYCQNGYLINSVETIVVILIAILYLFLGNLALFYFYRKDLKRNIIINGAIFTGGCAFAFLVVYGIALITLSGVSH